MYKNKRILALIPARGGSKQLPRKNIKPLSGKPLVAWTIKQAKDSKYIDKIIVSTDREEIARISKKHGAEVPFLRPKELATDEAMVIDVVIHAINWLKDNNDSYDVLMLLQPTSPLRLVEDIAQSIELLFLKNAKAIVSVCEVEYSPCWANILPADSCMRNFLRLEAIDKNRQELDNFYRINGAIYLAYCDYIKRQRGFFTDETFAYVMPRERSVDIDDELDFKFAEFLMKKRSS